MQHEVVLDPRIRDWVFLPLFALMFIIGILRHNVTALLKGEPKPGDKEQVKQNMALARSRRLRANCKHVPRAAFLARRHFLSNPSTGVFSQKLEQANPMAMMSDPDMMQNMMKGNMAMMVPQVVMMGVVNFFFSGFVLVKIPFPLTPSFKSMLQRGIPLASLDVTYVTSLSWYFVVLFGMRGLFQLVLGDNSDTDDTALMTQAMPGMAPGGGMPGQPVDNKKNFEVEKENLELTDHEWAVDNAENLYLTGGALKKGSRASAGKTKAQ
mmetsp:Transcript_4038/g.11470  ORF Transcript_4038/g.11470 Transcript_4038/m.11470 type:complete len:267 (-) Transcript_4038:199-999(-)